MQNSHQFQHKKRVTNTTALPIHAPVLPSTNLQASPEYTKNFGHSLERISIHRIEDNAVERNAVKKANATGLPDHLKTGIETLSGLSLDDVHVHYNSPQPAEVQALAYTQGTEIHVGPGQEQHLAHEAWHVVQQKRGRVHPTRLSQNRLLNDDENLEREADAMGTSATTTGQSVQNELRQSVKTQGNAQMDSSINRNTILPLQRTKKGGGGAMRNLRKSTIARRIQADPLGRTRGATRRKAGGDGSIRRRNLRRSPFKRASDGTRLWNGSERPSWNGADEAYYANTKSCRPHATKKDVNGNPVMEYKCVIDSAGTTAWLTRKKHADLGADFASIGHKEQWRTYIAKKAYTETWDVEGGQILAISLDEVNQWYTDNNNLELQGQSYNSSIARSYVDSEAPGQDWVEYDE